MTKNQLVSAWLDAVHVKLDNLADKFQEVNTKLDELVKKFMILDEKLDSV